MFNTKYLTLLIFSFFGILGFSQYTDVINSNRPGRSVSAYAIGKGVVQAEFGLSFEKQDHSLLLTKSGIYGADVSLRYGLLFETLELNWESTYQHQNLLFTETEIREKRTDFGRNRIGLKFLVYDPFKNPQANKPNLYSWKANHKFRFKNLLPAVSIYAGANFVLGDNPFYVGDPSISPRAMIATQSRITPRIVLISNIAYDRIGTDFPELSYLVSLSRALRNPKWSIFIENQGIKSDRYSDILFRTGAAYLFNESFQVDLHLGASIKNTPSRIFGTAGFSYRLDFHKDKVKAIEDQKANQNGGAIKKNAMKKKKKGKGAKDVDLGPSKKQLRKKNKTDKKKKKDNGVIEF